MIPTKAKTMRKSSKLEKKLQRAADGGIAVWTLKLNGLSRAARNKDLVRKEQALPGTKPVINEERMLVRVKWTIRQFEWYRDNKEFYYRLKQ